MNKTEYDYDEKNDIQSICWNRENKIESSIDLENVDIILDFNKDGKIIGIEIFDFKRILNKSQAKINKILSKEQGK